MSSTPHTLPEVPWNSLVCCAGYVQSIIDFLKTLPGIRGLVEREHSKMMVVFSVLFDILMNKGSVSVLLLAACPCHAELATMCMMHYGAL